MFETCEKQAYYIILTVIIYASSKQTKHWMHVKLIWWKNQLSKATEKKMVEVEFSLLYWFLIS